MNSSSQIQTLDYLMLPTGFVVIVFNLMALNIVIKHIFIFRRTQFYYKATTFSATISVVAMVADFWIRKYFRDFKFCMLVNYLADSLSSWAILATILLLSNIYLEMRLETGSLRFNSPAICATLSLLVVIISFAINLPFILINPSSNLPKQTLSFECQAHAKNDQLVLDTYQVLTKLVLPGVIQLLIVWLLHRRLLNQDELMNITYAKNSARFIKMLLRVTLAQSIFIASCVLSHFAKNFFESEHPSRPSKLDNLLSIIESACFLIHLIFYGSPFWFHLMINLKFRRRFFNLIQRRSSLSESKIAFIHLGILSHRLNKI